MSGAAVFRSRATGVNWSARFPSSAITGLSSVRKPGSLRIESSISRPPLGAGLGRRVRLHDEVGHPLLLARERAQHGVGVRRELAEHLVLAREDREHLVGLPQGGVGAMDDLAQLLAAAGDADAELAEQDRQPLALRPAKDVVDEVEVDRRVRPATGLGLERQLVLVVAHVLELGAALFVPWLHSTNFSPISDCGRTVHSASWWNGVKRESSMLSTTSALLSSVTSSDSIAPTLAPAIFTSSPGTAAATLSKIARTL